jgi:hypothetical protein
MYLLRRIRCMLPISAPLLVMVAMCTQFAGCAQTGKLVRKSHAFYVQRQPGTVRVDPSTGEEVARKTDTLITVYAETTKKDITWDTAWRNGRAYMVRAVLVGTKPAEAGTSKEGDHKIIITPAKGNFLWQLQLLPLPATRVLPASKGIRLRIIYKGVSRWHEAGEPVELAAVPSV